MLLWINGAFGVGKTQTAFELHRRLPGSVVCDPEEVGYGLHRMLPPALRGDFQDLVAWRQGVCEVLDRVLHSHEGVVLAPMTVVEPAYLRETIGELRSRGHRVHHAALLAERATVERRLRARVQVDRVRALGRAGGETFALQQLDRCLERLRRPEFAEHVPTDGLTVADVAERVAAGAGLTLRPGDRSGALAKLRRAAVSARHMRRV